MENFFVQKLLFFILNLKCIFDLYKIRGQNYYFYIILYKLLLWTVATLPRIVKLQRIILHFRKNVSLFLPL